MVETEGRSEAELLRGFCVVVPTYKSMEQQLTWNLEPRWDDCKGGGGGAGAREGVRKS